MTSFEMSEKLKILTNRDRLLRLNREKHTDIRTATAVTGTCLDMCSEVERLYREETKQLTSFEITPDKLPDPHAMVKEYVRAGADQPEPLPHELRPGPVLLRTMDYLICNIMNREESSTNFTGKWYDFIWNATRAIRKDIIQQHSCDLPSVSLLEKITRFHIHCAATLSEEDLSVFDPDINNENLTKCLHSLQVLYYDLYTKEDITCENEAEFQSYEILLNLLDERVLRKVRYLRKDIRDSEPVRFALKAYFAYNRNNFIEFFNLVKRASYLRACLLHRYFVSIRIQAIKLICKAYTAYTPYPKSDICRQLGFDNLEQAREFFEFFDIPVTKNTVEFTKEKRLNLNAQVPNMRSIHLVESKRDTSIGETVQDGPLPPNPYKKYPLHSSFDRKGKLKKDDMSEGGVKPIRVFMNFEDDLKSALEEQ